MIASGMPEDKMPTVTIDPAFTPATYNNPELVERLIPVMQSTFGEQRVIETPAVMGGYKRQRERNRTDAPSARVYRQNEAVSLRYGSVSGRRMRPPCRARRERGSP